MYTFHLQAVLDHRQRVEDQIKRELARIQRRLKTTQQELESLENRMNATMAALQQEQALGMSSDQVASVHTYLRRLAGQIATHKGLLAELETQRASKRDELNDALKRRKILENLKEQGLERYRRKIAKKEMDFIDEIAVSRFARTVMAKTGGGQ